MAQFKKGSKKPSNNRNSSRGNKRFYSKEDAKEISKLEGEKINNPAWYSESPQLLVDTASIPSAWITGLPLHLTTNNVDNGNVIFDAVQPGIMAFALHQRPCLNDDVDSPFNVMCTQLTAYARSINSGAKNWDAPDLGIYICAVANLYAMVSWAQRIYGTAKLFAVTNRYYPKDLLAVQKVDYENIVEHLSDFRAELNMLIAKVSSIPMPVTIPMAEKWAWSYKYYYSDSDNPKDQMYFYFPANYYTFAYDSESAGKLVDHPLADAISGDNITYDEICAIIDEQVTAILEDQDMAIIGGDLISAFGATKWSFSEIPENYTVVPVHEPEVLWQMRNIQTPVHFSVHDIVQNENKTALIQATDNTIQRFVEVSNTTSTVNVDLNDYLRYYRDSQFYMASDSDAIAPIEYVTNTRQTTVLDDYTVGDSEINCKWVTGTTVVTGIRVCLREVAPVTGVVTSNMYDFSTKLLLVHNAVNAPYQFIKTMAWFLQIMPALMKFKFCPSLSLIYFVGGGSGVKFQNSPLPTGEVKNYSLINKNILINMHRTCAMSESGMIRLALSRFNGTRQG